FMLMAREISVMMMQQMLIIGQFFDAKQQIETQRQIQLMQAQAHKDYHPSDLMCQFGSFMKSVPQSDEKAAFDKQAFSKTLMNSFAAEQIADTATQGVANTLGFARDMSARLKQFRDVYCDPRDGFNALASMCAADPAHPPATPKDPT